MVKCLSQKYQLWYMVSVLSSQLSDQMTFRLSLFSIDVVQKHLHSLCESLLLNNPFPIDKMLQASCYYFHEMYSDELHSLVQTFTAKTHVHRVESSLFPL